MSIPTEEYIKELFAAFGLAYYHSEVMCRGLAIFYTLASFRSMNEATKPRLEEKMVEAFSLTLGPIIAKVKPYVSLDLQTRLEHALEKRNFLAHTFWYDRAYVMQTDDGIVQLILELREYQALFDEIDTILTALTSEKRQELGITDDLLADQFQRGLAGEAEPPLPIKKPLGKGMIRIDQVYDVPLTSGGVALVFVTDDGQFLQLCDVGLGWSQFSEVGSQWVPNPVLSQYLPASVVPRPEVTVPWNYEFKLPKNAVLWVKLSSKEKMFRWGVKNISR